MKINFLSPKRIRDISFGEILNHKVINSRTFKPEIGGLFDPKIFGPYLNYECYCGKYKGKDNKGMKCERCEVMITTKNVQRWRMGHISLPLPITNIALFKTLSSDLSKILNISVKEMENIIYFHNYIVIDKGNSKILKNNDILPKKIDWKIIEKLLEEVIEKNIKKNDLENAKKLKEELIKTIEDNSDEIFLNDYLSFFKKNLKTKILIGSQAFFEILSKIDVNEEIEKIKKENIKKTEIDKLKFLKNIKKNEIKLEWIIMNNLLVIPCGLRPINKLPEEDVIATTYPNKNYSRLLLVIKKYNNFSEMAKFGVYSEEIMHNESRRLQTAVDKIIYGNTSKQKNISSEKSLVQSISGKEGILRRYTLGKRVDYSGRSVIVPDPKLLLNQVGLPIDMALSFFKPLIIKKIMKKKLAMTFKEAGLMINREEPIIFSILKEITTNYPVLVNRAPSLHRLSIQGFYINLTLGKSIKIHPLITTPLNADFDGDNVSIHLPLTEKAIEETKNIILSTNHILDPKNGNLIDVPTQDMILGIYFLSKEEKKNKKINFFYEIESIKKNFEDGKITLNELILVPSIILKKNYLKKNNKFVFTTYGKIIFNEIFPINFPFYINDLQKCEEEKYEEESFNYDEIKEKWEILECKNPWKKKDLIFFLNKILKMLSNEEMVILLDKIKEISFKYATYSGISISLFEFEKINKKEKKKEIEDSREKIEKINNYYFQGFYSKKETKKKISEIWEECKDSLQKIMEKKLKKEKDSSFFQIWDSGARFNIETLTQIFAMRGIITDYSGREIETPIINSLWDGLNPFEFFISVFGTMKGMIDLSLKTAEAGYLTRKLVESSQSVVINNQDCKTDEGLIIEEEDFMLMKKNIYGCYTLENVIINDNVIISKNVLITEKEIKKIFENKIKKISIRSPLKCELVRGMCQKCYGSDLSKIDTEVSLGTAVGIIAAQSLGEPGTQLTMRTFHTGGISGEEDIIQGLPKIKQILDNVIPLKEEEAEISKSDGIITKIDENEKQIEIEDDEKNKIIYNLKKKGIIIVKINERINKGQKITLGKINLEKYLEILGKEKCQEYMKREIEKVYYEQGIDINIKHIEVIIKMMTSRVRIENGGDSDYLLGDIANYCQIKKENKILTNKGKKIIIFKNIIFNLKDLASRPEGSFLSKISFQNTLKALTDCSLYDPIDNLEGIKSSLIAGQLAPIGEGFKERNK